MNLQQILSRVTRVLKSEMDSNWGEEELVDLINKGQDTLATRALSFTTDVTVVPADTDNVAFPADMLKILEVYWGDDEVTRKLLLHVKRIPTVPSATGTPSYYSVREKKIYLHPIPDTEKNLTLLYIQKPEPMEALNDEPHFEDSAEALIAYAIYHACLELGDPMVATWDEVYQREVKNFLNGLQQNNDSAFQVRAVW